MLRKPKPRKVPIVNKEYIWELEVEGQPHEYKVFVGENECITYEDGVECKHLKIMDKTQMQGVLQIDCKTKVFDDITDFQLENGIPYIKLEDEEGKLKWFKSDTTKEDELQARIRSVKKESYFYALLDCKLVTPNEARLMRAAIAQNALALPVSAKNVLRAAVLRNMLTQVFRNYEGGDRP